MIVYLLLAIVFLVTIAVCLFFSQAKFGKLPSGSRLERIRQSPNFRHGAFQNKSNTPDLTEGATYLSVSKEYFFGNRKRVKPADKIPSVKTDLKNLDITKDVLVWFGHSSYYLQVDGKRILVDPVLSGSASPLPYSVKAFNGSDIYTAEDIPLIDFLFISHDHWDHFDYKTLLKLKPHIKEVICGLGTGEHLEHWGFSAASIIEKDWDEEIILGEGFKVNTVSARHFSGRGLKRNQALWMSYVLQTPTMKIFIGGDSGYDTHFTEIGKSFGPFDLAILENGQYDKSWKHIHLMPEEVVKAARELNAKTLLPVHSAKFSISNHSWDEPLTRISALSEASGTRLITPRIGEQVNLKDATQLFTEWWKGIN
jgi:L-ascorbate metabolism protein UlaG (beta-lactamase superfamily)